MHMLILFNCRMYIYNLQCTYVYSLLAYCIVCYSLLIQYILQLRIHIYLQQFPCEPGESVNKLIENTKICDMIIVWKWVHSIPSLHCPDSSINAWCIIPTDIHWTLTPICFCRPNSRNWLMEPIIAYTSVEVWYDSYRHTLTLDSMYFCIPNSKICITLIILWWAMRTAHMWILFVFWLGLFDAKT